MLLWDTAANGRPPPESGRDSKEQVYFRLTCGQCRTKIQIKTAVKQPETAFECKVHGKGKRVSVLQLAALALLEWLLGPGSCTTEQYRLLEAMQKPVDIVVEQYALLVEVDGAQHAASSTGFGQDRGAQCERDQQFDRAVLDSGKRLLRLHWADAASWLSHMRAAIRRVQEQPSSSFVYYTASYPAHRRVM